MIVGIEATAHTFGIGIVNGGKILANITDMYKTEKGGIVPNKAAKHHSEVAEKVYKEALSEANIKEEDIDAIAFSQSPGLAPCLIEGLKFTKKIAKKLNKPIVPVNHCVSHLEIGKITGAKDPVLLYASGANTQIISYSSKKYRIFGETLDQGVGNFIDKFAREAGLGFPGGPKVEKLAKKGKYIELPYTVKGMDVTFSGLLTNLKQKLDKKYKLEDLAFSLQETTFAMLIEATERAMAHLKKDELLLGGGVACNNKLQEMARIMCEERGAKLYVPEKKLLVDNGAMIAYLGERMFKSGMKEDINNLDINPRLRTDDIDVNWK